MKILLLFTLILTMISMATAQKDDFEIGQPSELKGLKKIYIDAGTDLQNRDRIIKEIDKAKLGLAWVDEDDAEIIIMFKGSIGSVEYETRTATVYSGKFFVIVTTKTKPRLVMTYSNEQQSDWEQKPTTKFAKAFIKAYKQAGKSQ